MMLQVYEVESIDPFVRIWELAYLKSQVIAAQILHDPQPIPTETTEDIVGLGDDYVEVW